MVKSEKLSAYDRFVYGQLAPSFALQYHNCKRLEQDTRAARQLKNAVIALPVPHQSEKKRSEISCAVKCHALLCPYFTFVYNSTTVTSGWSYSKLNKTKQLKGMVTLLVGEKCSMLLSYTSKKCIVFNVTASFSPFLATLLTLVFFKYTVRLLELL